MLSRWTHELSQATIEIEQPLFMRGLARAVVTSVHHARHHSSRQKSIPFTQTIQIRFSLIYFLSPALPSVRPFPVWYEASLPLATTMTAVRCTSDAD
jgi:hypothetical protein